MCAFAGDSTITRFLMVFSLNHYMYPLEQEPLTREAAASEILAAAESYLARIR